MFFRCLANTRARHRGPIAPNARRRSRFSRAMASRSSELPSGVGIAVGVKRIRAGRIDPPCLLLDERRGGVSYRRPGGYRRRNHTNATAPNRVTSAIEAGSGTISIGPVEAIDEPVVVRRTGFVPSACQVAG